MPPADRCRSPRQVAAFLAVGLRKVLAWIHAGRLTAIDVGEHGRRQYRITPEALAEFAAGRAAATPKTPRRKPVKRPSSWVERY